MATITIKCKTCGKSQTITRIPKGDGGYSYFTDHKRCKNSKEVK